MYALRTFCFAESVIWLCVNVLDLTLTLTLTLIGGTVLAVR